MSPSDEVIPAAFALHNSPRRYALLLGSGISRDTGILTAIEITDDLIKQIAGGNLPAGKKPQDWYQETHEGRPPTFTALFDELAKSKEDRTAILRQYFEPKDKEGKPVRIEPTPAHQTIARLVRDGIISMIITTNFDPLLEEAIKRETGRDPVIITHESRPERMEVSGDHCRIVKVNGSYPDTDLKLTPADLADYSSDLKDYLHRIFSEYGLLICGWSGEHDTKLVEILTADRVRRFAIFWCSRESPEKIPETIRTRLHLSTIGITSANAFFGDLESRIDLLHRYERTSSLTVESAIKKIKDALKQPRPELVLSDLLHDETDRVLAEVDRTDFVPTGPIIGKAIFRNRLEELERVSAPLAAIVATLAFYTDGEYSDLITEVIDRLINLHLLEVDFLHDGQGISDIHGTELRKYLNNLRLYPALLVIYSAGITATRRENFNCLSAILEKPRRRQFIPTEMTWRDVPYFESVNIEHILWVVEQWTLEIGGERFGKQGNPYYYPTRVIQTIVGSLIPNEYAFEAAFDSFEYVYILSYLNQTTSEPTPAASPLHTRIWLQSVGFSRVGQIKFPDTLQSFLSEINQKIEHSVFFRGDSQRFLRCMHKYGKIFRTNPPKTDIPHPREGFPGL